MASPEQVIGSGPKAGGDESNGAGTYGWLWFAVVLFAVPLSALAIANGGSWSGQVHPAINAMLNGTSAVFLIAGYIAVKGGRTELHRRCMLTAVGASGLFLASYLVRFATTGAHKYPGVGLDKAVYLIILFSHMALAVALVPLALMTLSRGLRSQFVRHKAIARFTWPIWIYVSITGVIVYLMLYPLAEALYG